MPPKIICKGIVTLIDSQPGAEVQFDSNNRFYVIPKKLAVKYTQQDKVPVLFEHKENLRIGIVDKFYIDSIKVDERMRDALFVQYVIDNVNFIKALQKTTAARHNTIVPVKYQSSDHFLKPTASDGDTNSELDITAGFAVMQKVPGLSLAHDQKTLNILDVSVCVAGVREACITTDVQYLPGNTDEEQESNDISSHDDVSNKQQQQQNASEDDYILAFATLHSLSNGYRANKITSDMKALHLHPSPALQYSNNKKIDDENFIKVKQSETQRANNMNASDVCKNCKNNVHENTLETMYQIPNQAAGIPASGTTPVHHTQPQQSFSNKLAELIEFQTAINNMQLPGTGNIKINPSNNAASDTYHRGNDRYAGRKRARRYRVDYPSSADEASSLDGDEGDEYYSRRKRRRRTMKNEEKLQTTEKEQTWENISSAFAKTLRSELDTFKADTLDPAIQQIQHIHQDMQNTKRAHDAATQHSQPIGSSSAPNFIQAHEHPSTSMQFQPQQQVAYPQQPAVQAIQHPVQQQNVQPVMQQQSMQHQVTTTNNNNNQPASTVGNHPTTSGTSSQQAPGELDLNTLKTVANIINVARNNPMQSENSANADKIAESTKSDTVNMDTSEGAEVSENSATDQKYSISNTKSETSIAFNENEKPNKFSVARQALTDHLLGSD